MVYLLDANVLIALTIEEHEHHRRVSRWAATVDQLALCPIAEGALIRFLVRIGESARAAAEVLRLLRTNRRCDFWSDSVSYADADLSHVQGHRQVTDAYLAALVHEHSGARLATLDQALAREMPEVAYLIPPSRR
jgi:toxin-antitoxin system PIN domain toxin